MVCKERSTKLGIVSFENSQHQESNKNNIEGIKRGKGLPWKMVRTQAFFLLSPKSQNSQDTRISDYKEPRDIKMSSKDEGGGQLQVGKVEGTARLF